MIVKAFRKTMVFAAATCLLLPVYFARAQAGGGAAGGPPTTPNPQELQQITKQLDLTADQQSKVSDILQQLRSDVRDAMEGMQDASPEDRRSKMQNVQKLTADAKAKVEAELTPEQKTKYYPLSAKMAVKRMTDLLSALKTEGAKMEIADDARKQLNSVLDDSTKTLDGFKTDADAVKDSTSSKDLAQKITTFQADFREQVVDALGRNDAMKLMQSARQALRQSAMRSVAAPTTAPNAK